MRVMSDVLYDVWCMADGIQHISYSIESGIQHIPYIMYNRQPIVYIK